MTINRYERGALPNKSHSDLIKLLSENEEIFKEKVEFVFFVRGCPFCWIVVQWKYRTKLPEGV